MYDTSDSKSVWADKEELACWEHANTTFSHVHQPWHAATMHSVTDSQTDGQVDDMMMPIADHTVCVRSAKKWT